MKKLATIKPRDETTLAAIARYGYMHAEHVRRLSYPTAQVATATKRLTELSASYDEDARMFRDDGFLTFGHVHEKDGTLIGRPKRHFYLTPQNLRLIETAYAKRGKLDTFNNDFADAVTIPHHHGSTWSRTHVLHELKITDYALAFNHATKHAEQFLWERTSPKADGISRSYKVNKYDPRTKTTNPMTVRLNPDSVDLARNATDNENEPTTFFSFVEVDRATESSAELLQKIYAFDELQKPKNTDATDIADHFITRHGLAFTHPLFTDPDNYLLHIRIRFVTVSDARRNELIRLIAERSQHPSFYHVTTFDQLEKWDTFFTAPNWYVASDYLPILKREETEAKKLKRAAFNAWRDEQISTHMHPVPYFHTTAKGDLP